MALGDFQSTEGIGMDSPGGYLRGVTAAQPKAYHRCRPYLTVMASATRDHDETEGVVFTEEDDGSVTATDLETGLARGGDTRAEALAQLAEVLALHQGSGERIGDPDAFLQDELGIEPSEEERDLPDFLR
jgi:predicted RNase H-like HicB family nuclease